MNQESYQALTKMLNAFPQSAADLRGLLLTYDEDTTGVPDQAIIEAAGRFRRGEVAGQNKTFAPSIAEFCTEARRIAELLPYRGMTRLTPPTASHIFVPRDDPKTRARMGFKMAVLSASFGVKDGASKVAEANKRGLEDIIALGQTWGVAVPDELWAQVNSRTAS